MFIDKRTEFNKMLSMTINGELDVIIVMKLDRFSRSVEDASNGIKRIRQSGCFLIAGDIACMPQTPSDGLLLNIMTALNQYYAERAASDVMASECNNALKGFATGLLPYGYKIVRADRKSPPQIMINEDEAPAIRIMFEAIEQGESYNYVIGELEKQGFKTRKGTTFCKSTINAMLRNEKYCGNLIYNRLGGKRKKNRVLVEKFDEIRNEDSIPKIISVEQFNNVQKILSDKNRCRPKPHKSTKYILTGSLSCKCGRPMSGSMTGSKHIRNYICRCHTQKGENHCETRDINADKLERAVKIVLTDYINSYIANTDLSQDEIKKLYEEYTQDTTRYERKIVDLDKTINRLIMQSAKLTDQDMIKVYQKNIKSCQNECKTLQSQKAEKEKNIDRLNSLLSSKNKKPASLKINEIFYNDEISKKLVILLIDKIYVDNNEIKIKFNA